MSETFTSSLTEYRGFRITFRNENNAFNARPTADTQLAHPGLFPVAARSIEELTPVLDAMIERYASKVVSPAL